MPTLPPATGGRQDDLEVERCRGGDGDGVVGGGHGGARAWEALRAGQLAGRRSGGGPPTAVLVELARAGVRAPAMRRGRGRVIGGLCSRTRGFMVGGHVWGSVVGGWWSGPARVGLQVLNLLPGVGSWQFMVGCSDGLEH